MKKIKCPECGHINEYQPSDKSKLECSNCYEIIDVGDGQLEDRDFSLFKPNEWSFYIFSGGVFLKAILILMIFMSFGFVISLNLLGLVFSLPIGLLTFWLIRIKYQKTEYAIDDKSITIHT